MKAHPFADIFPMIDEADYPAFRADIAANGLRTKIITYDGMILDGRNRFRACADLGVTAHFEKYCGDDPLGFVLSLNLRRRHMNETQRAMVAARLENMSVGRPKKSPTVALAAPIENSANLRDFSISRDRAAAMLHVSPRSVTSAADVVRHGAPALVRAVEHGRIAVSQAAQAARLPVAHQVLIAEKADGGNANAVRLVTKQLLRAAREVSLGAKQAALPDRRYGLIYCDPEWQFEVFSRETGLDRAADNHYPTSSVDAIIARDMGQIAADDCVLAMWVTVPMLAEGLRVMAAAGFSYKTCFNWEKDRIGNGYWNRNRHELLLIGTRGHPPAPAMGTQFDSSIPAPLGRHSEKPEIFAIMLETYFPSLPKIELNRRGAARPGWDAWGNEATQ